MYRDIASEQKPALSPPVIKKSLYFCSAIPLVSTLAFLALRGSFHFFAQPTNRNSRYD